MSPRGKGALLILAGIIAIGGALALRYAKEQLDASWGGSRAIGDVFSGFAIVAFAILYFTWPIAVIAGLFTAITGRQPWPVAKHLVTIYAICNAVLGIGMIGVAYTSASLVAGVVFAMITTLCVAILLGGIRSRV